jgi:hypothetical protein
MIFCVFVARRALAPVTTELEGGLLPTPPPPSRFAAAKGGSHISPRRAAAAACGPFRPIPLVLCAVWAPHRARQMWHDQ